MRKTSPPKAAQPPTPEFVPTTVGLPLPLWTALKMRVAQERSTLREVCAKAIEAYLKTPVPERR
jgi:hypothetical protein